MEQRKTLIFYGDWLLKKMYFRNYSMVSGVHGQDRCGAFIGFLSALKNNIDFLNPDKVVVVWDGIHDGWFKYDSFPDLKLEKKEKWRNHDIMLNSLIYTNNTQKELFEIWQQRILIQDCLEDLCIRQIEEEHSEAYDVIALYAQQAKQEGEKVFLYGREFDYFQLISDQIYCIVPNKSAVISVHNFKTLYQYELENELLLKCVVGVNSSLFRKIKGVTRISMMKYYPEIMSGRISYKDFIHLTKEKQEKKRIKFFETIINSHDDIKVNSKILNLLNPFIGKEAQILVDEVLYGQLDLTHRNISFVKKMIRDRGMSIHINGNLEDFFSSFDRMKIKEKHYQESVNEET